MFILSVFIVFLLLTLCLSIPTPNDDIALMRQRALELSIWPSANMIPSTAQNAIEFSNTLNSSCYWPDVNYTDQTVVGPWKTYDHILRVTTMIQAVTVNGSSVRNDPKILAKAHCALNVWLVNDWHNPNWWFNEIGIPLQVTSQLLMLDDNVTSFEVEKITEISYRGAWWIPNKYHVGANRVWQIQCQIYRSLATKNITGIEQGFEGIWEDITYGNTTSVGVQNDWSYHFHTSVLYSGGYGLVWTNDILLFLQCSQNTRYQPNDQTLLFFATFLLKGDAWMIVTNAWDWHTLGRAISIPNQLVSHGFTTDWIRVLAQVIQVNETKTELINFADRLDNKLHAVPLLGNKYFYVSDYLVHRRTNWTATIKTQSIRNFPTECLLGQNIKDEQAGQGILNLYRPSTNDYSNVFPLFDWQAINGITVEHGIPFEPCMGDGLFNIQRMAFVGGVSDGQYGLAMMDTATHNLTAKRSWHFYDDAIIALATNLTLTVSTTAWTTLASRLLSNGQITIGFFNSTIVTLQDGNYSFIYTANATSNIQWIHLGESNIAYLLQLQQRYTSLEVQVGVKKGNFNTIGPTNYMVTARMLTLAINHGIGPYTLDYNYMILPNVSLESMPQLIEKYNEEQVFACMSTNNLFHGTMWPVLKRASFVLWDNITTNFSCKSPTFEINIQLSDAGSYLFSETNTDFTLTASHPTRWDAAISVIVDRVGHGDGCTSVSYRDAAATNMTVMLPSSSTLLGASMNVTCKK